MRQGEKKYRQIIKETPQSSEPIRGRGASWSPANRFEKLHVDVKDVDAVDVDPGDEPPSQSYGGPRERPRRATQYFRCGTKTIISRNNSPDVGFEPSVNPYRRCEAGCIEWYARPTSASLGLSSGSPCCRKY